MRVALKLIFVKTLSTTVRALRHEAVSTTMSATPTATPNYTASNVNDADVRGGGLVIKGRLTIMPEL